MPLPLFAAGAADTRVKRWTLFSWGSSFCPLVASLVFIVAGTVKADPCFSPLFGMPLAGVNAAIWHGISITASVFGLEDNQFNPFAVARNFIAPVPYYWKPALLTQGEIADEIALACVIAGDVAFDVSNGVLAFLAFHSS